MKHNFFQLRKKQNITSPPERTGFITLRPEPALAPQLLVANMQGTGDREDQQDAFGLSPLAEYEKQGLLAVLCDGMGGLGFGRDIAQSIVSEVISGFPLGDIDDLPSRGVELFRTINQRIFAQYRGEGGSTVIAVYLFKGKLWFWSVGDSDIFLLRDNRICALNCRHEYQNALLLRAIRGEIKLDVAQTHPEKGALTEYMGNSSILPDYTRHPFALKRGDCLLLCSDGVSDSLAQGEIERSMQNQPETCCQEMEQRILSKQLPNQDNFTAISIQYISEERT